MHRARPCARPRAAFSHAIFRVSCSGATPSPRPGRLSAVCRCYNLHASHLLSRHALPNTTLERIFSSSIGRSSAIRFLASVDLYAASQSMRERIVLALYSVYCSANDIENIYSPLSLLLLLLRNSSYCIVYDISCHSRCMWQYMPRR